MGNFQRDIEIVMMYHMVQQRASEVGLKIKMKHNGWTIVHPASRREILTKSTLDGVNAFISGWEEAVEIMKEGEK